MFFLGCSSQDRNSEERDENPEASDPDESFEGALDRIDLVPEKERAPLVCRLDSAEKFERAERLKKELFSHLLGVEELEGGYAMRFPAKEEMMVLIHEHVRTEWQCCPFFEFQLRYPPDHGPLEVQFKGGPEVKAMLRPKAEELQKALEKKG